MKADEELITLEKALENLSIALEYDDLKKGVINTSGGYFIHKGRERVIVHKSLLPFERVDVLMDILASLDHIDIVKFELPESLSTKISELRERNLAESVKTDDLSEPHDSPSINPEENEATGQTNP